MMSLFSYAQVRCLYDSGQFWDPEIAEPSPMPELAVPAMAAAGGPGLSVLSG